MVEALSTRCVMSAVGASALATSPALSGVGVIDELGVLAERHGTQ